MNQIKDALKYSRLGMWLRCLWSKESFLPEPTLLGKIIKAVIKLVASLVIVVFWIIVYVVVGVVCMFISLMAGLFVILDRLLFKAAVPGVPNERILNAIYVTYTSCYPNLLPGKPDNWPGRDRPLPQELNLPNESP